MLHCVREAVATIGGAVYQPELESMSRSELESLQLARLKSLLLRVYEHVPAYRAKFDAAGFDPTTFESLERSARVCLSR